MTILDQIFEAKRARVADAKRAADYGRLIEVARATRADSKPNRLMSAMSNRSSVNVIAEFKRASPSKGTINESFDPAETARLYERAGARAMSVLTEEDYFRGSLEDLKNARAATSLPILRKDFIFDPFQIVEAAAAGADAVLLIVAALDEAKLFDLRSAAEELGLDALVEVHTKDEMLIAKSVGAKLVGVNNRDLKSFEVTLDISRELIEFAPPDAVLISESGITSKESIEELLSLGYSGFLIGESLMRSERLQEHLSELSRVN